VTRPTAEMRRAMAEAEVGDDVYSEDPTMNRLQERAAEIFEREAAIFVPSGCLGNLLAIKTWTQPGQEVICDERAHINQYELGSMTVVAGCVPRTVRAPRGVLNWDLVEPAIRPKVFWYSQTALISIENTHNMAGGVIQEPKDTQEICDKAHERGIKVHMDGARIFNAAVAAGKSVAEMSKGCDSVMFALSKGLGAPVGSMLLGPHDFIEKARITRKMLGGGMRQAGILAAAGLIALEKPEKNLKRDHENARYLAEGLAEVKGIEIDASAVKTNVLVFGVRGTGKRAAEIAGGLKKRGVLWNPAGEWEFRIMTHCDVDREGVERALEMVREVVG
jgi:threonine aldolase